ncbi:MAG: glycerophosphodiester phosphodiesterase [Planctomycetaceae bacterium]|nr:glycerophosphodiester phosphodiesterase [Planctomycetaceae bacterium]
MTFILASNLNRRLSMFGSFHFVVRKITGVYHLAVQMVGRGLLLSIPFLASSGGLYLIMLTQHDINYYLTEKPLEYWIAVSLIGTVLIVMALLLARLAVNWSIALPLHLFEGVPRTECLKTSQQRVHGHRKTIAGWIIVWLVIHALISSIGLALIVWLGRILLTNTTEKLWPLVFKLGGVLLAWTIVNTGTGLLAVISFALVLTEVYQQFGKASVCEIPEDGFPQPSWTNRLTRNRMIVGLVLGFLISSSVSVTAIHSLRLEDHVDVTAHRGASGKAPENTMAAVRQAIADGADWVEIDVQESKDGVVMVAHDSDLMKVAGVKTKIWEATAKELQAIDVGSYFDPKFKDETVPTLNDVLNECRGHVRLNIELKYYGHDQDLERRVVDLVERFEMEPDVVVMSLESKAVRKMKSLRPNWTVGLLTAVKLGDLTSVDADFLAVNTKLATRPFIESAHAREKQVHVWTVNDAITMSSMISRGVDNVITDDPELARRVLAERSMMSPVERVLLELGVRFGAFSKAHTGR